MLKQWLRKKFRRTTAPQRRHFGILELHVTHVCNLTCESCSHYSNYGHLGHISLKEAADWMGAWSDRVTVGEFQLLGGEPTIHPELPSFVVLVREHWPDTPICIVTNGFFLNRHPDLPRIMAKAGNTEIIISIHHDSPEYQAQVAPALALAESWGNKYGITVKIRESNTVWTRRYRGFGKTMSPFEDHLPRQSWEICPARYCKQLYQGRIWKCAPLAYLPMQHAKFGLSEKWSPYLSYEPLDPSCSDQDLDLFIEKEDEWVCSMCSAERREMKLPVPMRKTVRHEL